MVVHSCWCISLFLVECLGFEFKLVRVSLKKKGKENQRNRRNQTSPKPRWQPNPSPGASPARPLPTARTPPSTVRPRSPTLSLFPAAQQPSPLTHPFSSLGPPSPTSAQAPRPNLSSACSAPAPRAHLARTARSRFGPLARSPLSHAPRNALAPSLTPRALASESSSSFLFCSAQCPRPRSPVKPPGIPFLNRTPRLPPRPS
jgi:hypothetical protein